MKKAIILLMLVLLFHLSESQVLHTESFAVILDTSKTIKGSFTPDFKFQNLKKDLLEFENTTDITFKFKGNAITIANKIELSKYGKETLLSGGFLYMEYRRIIEKRRLVLEPYAQMHWSDPRGLELKYASGFNFRYRLYYKNLIGMYIGSGPFYEFERWNYDGVPDELLPPNPQKIEKQDFKIGSYISFKWKTPINLDIDISLYHQSKLNEFFYTPRLASSSSIKYNFTDHLGLIVQYQTIYDYAPVVPIDKLFNVLSTTIEVSF
ncbi:DUF481 domain-containing protein [Tenuifilum thalassicum]|uniref:DUF481 domain-containing protein n=1 Tax=Tenuifilum thalassicum TaxID=2590900 RepID=A0A7D4BK72_9BACT|nr:DUF481 domain-containing protein [Tenuifilum thalassicum]QKG80039.1 DUF481 domain-containing protein [Tenuifilum thalassicum]